MNTPNNITNHSGGASRTEMKKKNKFKPQDFKYEPINMARKGIWMNQMAHYRFADNNPLLWMLITASIVIAGIIFLCK